MKALKLAGIVCVGLAASFSATNQAVADANDPVSFAPEKQPGAWTLGAFGSKEEFYVQGDFLVPLVHFGNGLAFLNPRGTLGDRNEEELNVGLGVRWLLDTRYPFILGANLYYDGRWSRHNNRFDQIGLGVEALGDRVDVRANYYIPDRDTMLAERVEIETTSISSSAELTQSEQWNDPYAQGHQILQDGTISTTTRNITSIHTVNQTFERYEAALEGFDAEIGLRLSPNEWPVETRVFGGYQHFDNPFGSALKGWKGRLEMRALGGLLTFDAHLYENGELNRGEYLVGGRVTLPFDLTALAQGSNPFAGSFRTRPPRRLEQRLGEMVMRDPKIQSRESDFIENLSRRSEQTTVRNNTSTQSKQETAVLADGVIFVHGDTGNDDNPGTAEEPKQTIQNGVDNVSEETCDFMDWPDGQDRRAVYVFAASQPYEGFVTLSEERIALIGSGYPLQGRGGKIYGGGNAPLVLSEAIDEGPAVGIFVAADYAAIAGFEITAGSANVIPNGDIGPNSDIGDIGGEGDIGGDGIGIKSFSLRIAILNNTIYGNAIGALIIGEGDADIWLKDNTFVNNANAGSIEFSDGGHFEEFLTVGGGFFVAGEGGAPENDLHFRMTASGNQFDFNLIGMVMDAQNYASVDVKIENNVMNTFLVGGYFLASASQDVGLTLAGNQCMMGERGFLAELQGENTTLRAERNRISETEYGMVFDLSAVGGALQLEFERNVLIDNEYGLTLSVGADASSYDLNLGRSESGGRNSFDNVVNNFEYWDPQGIDVDAQFNWWGSTDPAEFKIDDAGTGAVDSGNPLAADPNP